MSKWTLCLFMTLVIVFSSVVSAYAEDEPEETQLNTLAAEERYNRSCDNRGDNPG